MGLPPAILNNEALAYPVTSKLDEIDAPWLAVIRKILDIEATTPDELAISK